MAFDHARAHSAPRRGKITGDPDVDAILRHDAETQRHSLQLIASENFVSGAVQRATGSLLTNRFADRGYRRTYGMEGMDADVEALANRRACALFTADHANAAPHSGTSANLAACLAVLEPGDTLMGLRSDAGGHISHGGALNLSGIIYRAIGYGVRASDGRLDLDIVADLAKRERPRVIFCGSSAYPRIIDAAPFREICDSVGATLVFDAAHIAGLIAGGVHPNPTAHADVVTLTTHKTLRGPRGGALLSRRHLATRLDQAVSPGVQGDPLLHVIAGKAVAFAEAAQPEFRHYASAVVNNARALGHALQAQGFTIVTGGTDTHMVLADLRPIDRNLSGRTAVGLLDRIGISVTRCPVGDDPRLPGDSSGIKFGTAALTTRGAGPNEMEAIARLVAQTLRRPTEHIIGEANAAVKDIASHLDPGR